jgi:hypothetical protein
MSRYLIAICSLITLTQFAAGANYRSIKGGFEASFPAQVEEVVIDQYSSAWTSFDFIDELFVMHQVAILKERPGGPLHYESVDEYRAFFKEFLNELMQGYSKSKVITSEYYLWKGKYPAFRYTFQGVMVDYDIEVINEGLALIYNRKFVKSALIFPDILKEDAKLIRMVNRFHNSLIVF